MRAPPPARLRVLYSFPDTVGAPGIGVAARQHTEELARLGHEVHLYCTAVAGPAPAVHRVVTTLSVAGARIPHRALGRARAYHYHDRRVALALRRLAGEIDVVHVWPRATVATAAAARRADVPVLREAPNTHTAFAYERVAEETEMLGLPAVAGHSHEGSGDALRLEEQEYEAASMIAVLSEYCRQTFLDRGIAPDRLGLHGYGFDPGRFPAPESLNGRRPDGLRAVFVGRCEPRKGLHYALEAWIESGAAQRGTFTICGRFYPGYEEVLGRWLRHPSVRVLGWVDDPGELMRESDVFLFPSIEEGSAFVTYEAQASGCALVVSDATGARCEHMHQGLVHEAGDLSTLTDHLRLLDADRDLLQRLRANAVASRPTLTWEYSAGEIAGLYRDLVAR
ncbi:MAG TPA: glycosyltransferase family 4 protein [Gaiellaceae bacterium]|nr:glycosyltransferase family 4 protein [Gaiellaceae bacterium]HXV96492.1 glycosyltransferase family 4 protein [Gaiellaceae bacterium]